MGFFDFLKPKKSEANIVHINHQLGNSLITGETQNGKTFFFENVLYSCINDKVPTVVIRDVNSNFDVEQIYNENKRDFRDVYSLDLSDVVFSKQFSPFAGKTDDAINKFIISIFDKYMPIEKSKLINYVSYISKLREIFSIRDSTIPLDCFFQYTLDKAVETNERMRGINYSANARLFETMRQDIATIESYFYVFKENSVGKIISGNLSLERIINKYEIIDLVLDFSRMSEESMLMLYIFIDALTNMKRENIEKRQVAILIAGLPTDAFVNSDIIKLFNYSNFFKVFYEIDDLENLVSKKNYWFDKTNTFIFFNQTSPKNRTICAEFFGKVQRAQYSYSSSTSSDGSWFSPDKTVTQGTTRTMVTEYMYKEEVFANLKDNQCLIRIKQYRSGRELITYLMMG